MPPPVSTGDGISDFERNPGASSLCSLYDVCSTRHIMAYPDLSELFNALLQRPRQLGRALGLQGFEKSSFLQKVWLEVRDR